MFKRWIDFITWLSRLSLHRYRPSERSAPHLHEGEEQHLHLLGWVTQYEQVEAQIDTLLADPTHRSALPTRLLEQAQAERGSALARALAYHALSQIHTQGIVEDNNLLAINLTLAHTYQQQRDALLRQESGTLLAEAEQLYKRALTGHSHALSQLISLADATRQPYLEWVVAQALETQGDYPHLMLQYYLRAARSEQALSWESAHQSQVKANRRLAECYAKGLFGLPRHAGLASHFYFQAALLHPQEAETFLNLPAPSEQSQQAIVLLQKALLSLHSATREADEAIEQAKAWLAQANASFPTLSHYAQVLRDDVYWQLGQTLEACECPEEAIAYFRQVTQDSPHYQDAQFRALSGEVLQETRDPSVSKQNHTLSRAIQHTWGRYSIGHQRLHEWAQAHPPSSHIHPASAPRFVRAAEEEVNPYEEIVIFFKKKEVMTMPYTHTNVIKIPLTDPEIQQRAQRSQAPSLFYASVKSILTTIESLPAFQQALHNKTVPTKWDLRVKEVQCFKAKLAASRVDVGKTLQRAIQNAPADSQETECNHNNNNVIRLAEERTVVAQHFYDDDDLFQYCQWFLAETESGLWLTNYRKLYAQIKTLVESVNEGLVSLHHNANLRVVARERELALISDSTGYTLCAEENQRYRKEKDALKQQMTLMQQANQQEKIEWQRKFDAAEKKFEDLQQKYQQEKIEWQRKFDAAERKLEEAEKKCDVLQRELEDLRQKHQQEKIEWQSQLKDLRQEHQQEKIEEREATDKKFKDLQAQADKKFEALQAKIDQLTQSAPSQQSPTNDQKPTLVELGRTTARSAFQQLKLSTSTFFVSSPPTFTTPIRPETSTTQPVNVTPLHPSIQEPAPSENSHQSTSSFGASNHI